jgi:hypothetical protein
MIRDRVEPTIPSLIPNGSMRFCHFPMKKLSIEEAEHFV